MKEPSDGDKPAKAGAQGEPNAARRAGSSREVHAENASAEKPGRFWRRILSVDTASQLSDQALDGDRLRKLQAALSGNVHNISTDSDDASVAKEGVDALNGDEHEPVFLLAGLEVQEADDLSGERSLEDAIDDIYVDESSPADAPHADAPHADALPDDGVRAASQDARSANWFTSDPSTNELDHSEPLSLDDPVVLGADSDVAPDDDAGSDGENKVDGEPGPLARPDVEEGWAQAASMSVLERDDDLEDWLTLPSDVETDANAIADDDTVADGDSHGELDRETVEEGEPFDEPEPDNDPVRRQLQDAPSEALAEEALSEEALPEDAGLPQPADMAEPEPEDADGSGVALTSADAPDSLAPEQGAEIEPIDAPTLMPDQGAIDIGGQETAPDAGATSPLADNPGAQPLEDDSAALQGERATVFGESAVHAPEVTNPAESDPQPDGDAAFRADADAEVGAAELKPDPAPVASAADQEPAATTQSDLAGSAVAAAPSEDSHRPLIPTGLSGGGATRPPRPTSEQAAVPATLVKAMMGVRGHRAQGDSVDTGGDVSKDGPVGRRRVLANDDASAADDPDAVDDRLFVESNSIGALFIGARVTKGLHDLKSVEREIRIKVRYLEAIEAIEPDGLPKEAYIPGYVKTYARYLQSELPLGADEAYEKFRKELNAKLERLGRPTLAPPREMTPGASDRAGAVRAKRMPPPSASERIAAEAARQRSEMQVAGPVAGRALDPMGALRKAAERSGAGSLARDPVATRRAAGDIAGKIARARAKAKRGAFDGGAAQEPWITRFAPLVAMIAAIGLAGGIGFGLWRVLEDAQRVGPADDAVLKALRVVERRDGALPAGGDVERPSAAAYADGTALTTLFEREDGSSNAGGQQAAPGDGVGGLPRPAPTGPNAAPTVVVEKPAVDAASADATPAPTLPAVPLATPRPPKPSPDPSPAPSPEPTRAAPEAPTRSIEREREERRLTGPAFGIYAIEDTWLRVRDRRGRELLSGILAAGATAALPADRGALEIRAGNAGGVAFVVNGLRYGPVGASGDVQELWIGPGRIPEQYPAWSRPGG